MHQRVLSILALLGFVCSLLASSAGSVVSTSTEEFWEVKLIGSTPFGSAVRADLDWDFGFKTLFEDIPRATTQVEGQLAISLVASPLCIQFGHLEGDSRFSTLTSSGLDLSCVSGNRALALGPPRVTKSHLSPDRTTYWTLSIPANNLYVHLFAAGLPHLLVGNSIGILTESALAAGILRIGALSVQRAPPALLGPVYPYGALSIQSGMVVAGSYSARAVEVVPTLPVRLQFIYRFAYDEFMGTGVTLLSRIEIGWRELSLQYDRILIPSWCGAVGALAFTTVDAPLKRDELSVSWDGKSFSCELTCTDSWWRPTAFAGDSQRRVLRFRGMCSYRPSRELSFGVRASWEMRWNRSGSEGQTFTATFPVACSFRQIDLSVRPQVRWTVDPIWSVQIRLSIPSLGADGNSEMDVVMSVKRTSCSVSLRWSVLFEKGRVMCELTTDGSVRVTYSTAL